MIAAGKGKNTAIVGAVCQLVFVAAMLAVWLVTGSRSALAVLLMIAGGMGVWLVTALLFYCRQLARREAMELEELAAGGGTGSSIFKETAEGELRPAAARLARMERWAPPTFTLLWCGYNAAIGVLLLRHLARTEPVGLDQTGVGLLLSFLAGFVSFLFSRYCTGMATQRQWRLLRAPGSFLLVNVLFVLGVAAALALHDSWDKLDRIVAFAAAFAQLILAVELLANLIMDFYRPRIPGREERFSYDSRLCNLLAEPQRTGRSIAETLNYQFGFEVSKTWFYRLVSKAFIPLLVFGVLVLFGMSSIVIVRAGEEAILLHWGRPAAPGRTLGPGLHLKWPWPIDTARRFSTTEVHEIWLGLREQTKGEQAEEHADVVKGRRLELWADMHVHEDKAERDFVLASPREPGAEEKGPPPVSLIKLVALVQYVIEDTYKYGYRFVDPASTLRCVAERELVQYGASATLYQPAGQGDAERPEAIMTYGRQRAADELKRRIQRAVEDPAIDLGVRIVHVGLRAVHPVPDAAEAFEKVITARHEVNQLRYEAEAKANQVLSDAAGSPPAALRLALAITRLEQLKALRRLQAEPAQMRAELEKFLYGTRDDVRTLDGEIETERLLGRITPYKQGLRKEHQRHLALLLAVRRGMDGSGGVDLAAEIEKARKAADDEFEKAEGQPVALVRAAHGRRWATELAERSRLLSFQKELPAYEASPNLYRLDRWLDVWDKVLPGMYKYVIGVDPDKVEFWVNLERPYDPSAGVYEPKESSEKE